MKQTVIRGAYLFLAGLMGLCLFASCNYTTEALAKSMARLDSAPAGPERIEELKRKIELHRAVVEQTVKASEQSAELGKMLVLEYLQRNMFGEAWPFINTVIEQQPMNASLFNMRAICAGWLAKAKPTEAEKREWLGIAESAWTRSLELEPGNAEALYGLAVLYVFELDNPQGAVGLLEELLRKEERNIEGLFVLARAYVLVDRQTDAIDAYDRIIALSTSEQRKTEARRNRDTLLGRGFR